MGTQRLQQMGNVDMYPGREMSADDLMEISQNWKTYLAALVIRQVRLNSFADILTYIQRQVFHRRTITMFMHT